MLTPEDAHNRDLLAQVHPPTWRNPVASGRYNLVVIGAGTAGLVCAAGAAGLGAKVALIERHLMGGDCLNFGCVPSKALLRCARAAHEVRRAEEFGIRVAGSIEVDFAAIMERMRRLRARLSRHDSAERFRSLGVDVFLGDARFTGPDTVEVAGQTLRFARAVIATGARPVTLDVPGNRSVEFLTNETIFSLTELPRRLAVLGAGPIGCELGQAFQRFGSEVHLIERGTRLLFRDEPRASDVLQGQFQREGIHLHLQTEVVAANGSELTLSRMGTTSSLVVDAVLVALGRRPNVEGLGLEQAGVAYDSQGVTVDDFLRTTNRRIYAAGDVCSQFQFTHAADAMARIVLRNALFFGRSRHSALVIPHCTYTEPEVAAVGLTVAEAEARGLAINTLEIPLSGVDRAVLDGDEDGFALVHRRRDSDRLVGVTLVSSHAGELIGELVLAQRAGLGLAALSEVIHPYPTVADVWKRLGDAYQKSRLTPFLAGLFRTLLRWRR